MNNHQMMMSDDLFARFEKELNIQGLSKSPVNNNDLNVDLNLNNISIAEERAWMLHQQNPLSGSGPFVTAFHLKGKINIDRLIQGIKSLYRDKSNLNLSYFVDELGHLKKRHQDLSHLEVGVEPIQHDVDAIDRLLAEIEMPMDLTTNPPVRFILFPKTEHELVLGIVGHHILLDDTAWKPIFDHLSYYYSLQKNLKVEHLGHVKTFENANLDRTSYWQQQFESGLKKVSWPRMFLHLMQPQSIIKTYGVQQETIHKKVNRVVTHVDGTELKALSDKAQASVVHTMTSLFGCYIQSILGLDDIDLFIPVVENYDITGLDQICSSSNVIPIRLSGVEQGIEAHIRNTRNQILEGISHNLSIEQILSITKTKRQDIPNILVTQFTDATTYLNLEGVEATSIPIPPIDADYDLTLAFQIQDNQLQIELTTGGKLSRHIAPWLLEQFIQFFTQRDYTKKDSIFQLNASIEPTSKADIYHAVPLQEKLLTDSQTRIANIILDEFRNVLAMPELSLQDNFFDQGGHSILATRVIGKLQSQHQIEVKIADFFNAPTAFDLVQYASYREDEDQKGRRYFDPKEEIYAPITILQKEFMGFSDQGRDAIFNIPFAFRLSEWVNEDAFELAFKDILERHHALRSIFIFHTQDDISQTVIPMTQLDQYPWFFNSNTQGQQSANDVLKQEANHSFDLEKEFPIRVRFLKDEDGQHILSLLIYHIAMDEWSTGILIQELFEAYKSRLVNQAPMWQKNPKQFHEYAVEQDDLELKAHLAHWVKTIGKLKKQPPLLHEMNVDTDFLDDVTGSAVEFSLNNLQVDELYQLAKQNQSSIFYVVYAAIVLAIHFIDGNEKILTGTSVACRDHADYQDTIGYFTNVVMHHTQFDETMSISQLIQQVQNNIFNTLPYADVPFAMVEAHIRDESETSTDSPYEVYIQLHAKNLLTGTFATADNHQIGFELIEPERSSSKFGLHFEVYEEPLSEKERLRVVINYRTQRYNNAQIECIQQVTSHVLNGFLQKKSIEELDVMQLRRYLAIHMTSHDQGAHHVS